MPPKKASRKKTTKRNRRKTTAFQDKTKPHATSLRDLSTLSHAQLKAGGGPNYRPKPPPGSATMRSQSPAERRENENRAARIAGHRGRTGLSWAPNLVRQLVKEPARVFRGMRELTTKEGRQSQKESQAATKHSIDLHFKRKRDAAKRKKSTTKKVARKKAKRK